MNRAKQSTTKALKHSSQLIYMINECINQRVITKAAGKVFIAISSYWGPRSKIYPSRITLAKLCGYKTVRNITLQTAKLTGMNLLSFSQVRNKTKSGKYVAQNNVYKINYPALQALYALAIQKKRDIAYAAKIKQRKEDARLDRELVKVIHTTNKIDPPATDKNDPPFSTSISKHRSENNNASCMSLLSSLREQSITAFDSIIAKAKIQKKNGIIKIKQLNNHHNWRVKMGFEFAKNDKKKITQDKQDALIVTNRALIDSNTNQLNELTAKLSTAALYRDSSLFKQHDFDQLTALCGGTITGIAKVQSGLLGYGN